MAHSGHSVSICALVCCYTVCLRSSCPSSVICSMLSAGSRLLTECQLGPRTLRVTTSWQGFVSSGCCRGHLRFDDSIACRHITYSLVLFLSSHLAFNASVSIWRSFWTLRALKNIANRMEGSSLSRFCLFPLRGDGWSPKSSPGDSPSYQK